MTKHDLSIIRQRLDAFGTMTGSTPPSEVIDGTGAPTDDFLAYADAYGMSLDWAILGQGRPRRDNPRAKALKPALEALEEARRARDFALATQDLIEQSSGTDCEKASAQANTVASLNKAVAAAEFDVLEAPARAPKDVLAKVAALSCEGMSAVVYDRLRTEAKSMLEADDPLVDLCARWHNLYAVLSEWSHQANSFDAPEANELEAQLRELEAEIRQIKPRTVEGMSAIMSIYWKLEGPEYLVGTDDWVNEMNIFSTVLLRRIRAGLSSFA